MSSETFEQKCERRIAEQQAAHQYARLIVAVNAIDVDAAVYMDTDARKLAGFTPNGDLTMCFDWEITPQGLDFWAAIYDSLIEGAS